MRERRGHAEIGDEELDDPCAGVEGEALFLEKYRVDLEVVVEDRELVVDSAVFVEKFLRELYVGSSTNGKFTIWG
jgi:hypothetical protein